MRIAFVSGGTRGIGRAIADRLQARGYKVIASGTRPERPADLPDEMDYIGCNIGESGQRAAAFRYIRETYGRLDVLVNNAGVAHGLEPAWECSLDDWDGMVDTNIKGLLYATRAVLPGMVERNSGHVVMLGSVAGNYSYAGGNVYCGTKAFVKQFALALRADLLGKNIRVNNVEPGLCISEFSEVRFRGDAERAAKVYEGTQPVTPEDIAELIWWLVNCPAHVNINRVEVMPLCQCPSGPSVKKGMPEV